MLCATAAHLLPNEAALICARVVGELNPRIDNPAHDSHFVGMSTRRVHMLISDEAFNWGRKLAHKKGVSVSKIVEGFLLSTRGHATTGKTFSQRWAGKVGIRKIEKSDRRGLHLKRKHA